MQPQKNNAAISWPIVLAIIPTLGAFIAGNAEVWSDFIMVLLVLYYVYKWITVPWSYYESARARRANTTKRKESVEQELRRHELIGLIWVIVSPAIAGYTLQYSRYILSNHDKYMSTFNVTVFVLAASIKPLIHIIALLTERTLFLQSEVVADETEIQVLAKKLEIIQEELDGLRKAYATKRDLGQVTQGITPSIQQLSKALKKFERKETELRSWSEEKFTDIDQKVQDFDQFICYTIEQNKKSTAQRFIVTLVLLPLNLTFWAAKRMTVYIPSGLVDLTSTSSRHLTHSEIRERLNG